MERPSLRPPPRGRELAHGPGKEPSSPHQASERQELKSTQEPTPSSRPGLQQLSQVTCSARGAGHQCGGDLEGPEGSPLHGPIHRALAGAQRGRRGAALGRLGRGIMGNPQGMEPPCVLAAGVAKRVHAHRVRLQRDTHVCRHVRTHTSQQRPGCGVPPSGSLGRRLCGPSAARRSCLWCFPGHRQWFPPISTPRHCRRRGRGHPETPTATGGGGRDGAISILSSCLPVSRVYVIKGLLLREGKKSIDVVILSDPSVAPCHSQPAPAPAGCTCRLSGGAGGCTHSVPVLAPPAPC